MADLSLEKLNGISRIAIVLHSYDIEYIDNNRWWGLLKLLPNLTSLQIIDEDWQSEKLLANPKHAICRAMKGLKGLTELVIVVDESNPVDDDRHLWEEQKASELASIWREFATQPNLAKVHVDVSISRKSQRCATRHVNEVSKKTTTH